jgi:polysaccharide export outer membrane protein
VKTVLLIALALAAAQESSKGERANYVVGPGDVLAVHVFYEPQLSGNFRVENDGHFGYPFLGRVSAAGKTVAAISTLLKDKLSDGYLRTRRSPWTWSSSVVRVCL